MNTTAVDTTEAWGETVWDDILGLGGSKGAWVRLLEHVTKGTRGSSLPSARWRQRAAGLAAEIQREELLYVLDKWFTGICGPGGRLISNRDGISQTNQTLLIGLVWVTAQLELAWLMPKIAGLAACSYQKIAHGGSRRAARLGNVCIRALGAQRDPLSIAFLCELGDTLPHRGARHRVATHLEAMAVELGTTVDSLGDLVPDFGLDSSGCVEHRVGEWTALIEVTPGGVQLTWQRQLPGGQGVLFDQVRPAEVRSSRPPRLELWERYRARIVEVTAWQIERTLEMQRARVEAMYQKPKRWSFAHWHEHLFEHPLLGPFLVKRLIWRFEQAQAAPVATLCWATGQPTDVVDPGRPWTLKDLHGTHVVLWHPLLHEAREAQWQDWVIQAQCTQPLKQAFRETYTDLGLPETDHTLVRQHQFQALLKQAGWQTKLQGTWTPARPWVWRTLACGTRCRLRLIPLVDEAITTRPGAYVYVQLAGVDFLDVKGNRVPAAQINPVWRSEAMREVAFAAEISTVTPAQVDEVLQGALVRLGRQELVRSTGGQSEAVRLRALVLGKVIPRTHWMRNHLSLEEGVLCCVLEGRTWTIELRSGLVWSPWGRMVEVPVTHEVPRVTLPYQGDQTLGQIVSRSWKVVTGSLAHLAGRGIPDAPGRRSS